MIRKYFTGSQGAWSPFLACWYSHLLMISCFFSLSLSLSPVIRYILGNNGVWTQGLMLARQVSTTWGNGPKLFFFSYLLGRNSCFCPRVSLGCHPTMPLTYLWWQVTHYHTQIVGWDGVSLSFCLAWPQITILLIATSQVGGIAGMSYCANFCQEICDWFQNFFFDFGTLIMLEKYF
jgi:hypothetical protein